MTHPVHGSPVRRNLGAAACLIVVVSLLLGRGILPPVMGQGHAGNGFSSPQILCDASLNHFMTTLTSDRFGNAHAVWKLVDQETYFYSRWDGAAWSAPLDIVSTTGDVMLGPPVLVAAADGRLHLFWAQDRVMHTWAWVGNAAETAKAWSVPEAVVFPDTSTTGPMDAKQDRFGGFHLVYSLSGGEVYYIHSDGEQWAWTEPSVVSRAGIARTTGSPRLDVDPEGRIHVVWDEWPSDGDPAESSEVYYANSVDEGGNWSEPSRLGEQANRGGNVLAGEDGILYLAWQAGIWSQDAGRFLQWSSDGGNTWEGPVRISESRGQSGCPRMALDSLGILHILTGDGEYVFWDGRSVSNPLDLRPLPEQTQFALLTIVNGNQVLVVMGPDVSALYYAVRQLGVPASGTVALPTRPPRPTTTSRVGPVEATGSPESPVTRVAFPDGAAPREQRSGSSSVSPLVTGAGLSLVVMAVVLAVQLARHSR